MIVKKVSNHCRVVTIFTRLRLSCVTIHPCTEVLDMKKKRCVFGITLVAALLASCASQFVFIAPQTCAEATALKNICNNLSYDMDERRVTDSLYNQGANLIRTGKSEKAHILLSRVIVRYRLLLERQAVAEKEREIELQRRGLADDLHELSKCQRIITELTPAEQP
jgi:hypothetical protein